jgi:hypothetical protein
VSGSSQVLLGNVLSMVLTKPLVPLEKFVLIMDPPGRVISSIFMDVLLLLQAEVTDVFAISRRYIFRGGGKNKLCTLVISLVPLLRLIVDVI